MAKHKKHSVPTADRLRRYVSGTLSPSEQYQIERAALENAQTEDTLEGLLAQKEDNVDEKAALDDLRQRLRRRVSKSDRKVIPFYYASAAALLLAVGLSWWLIRDEEPPLQTTAMKEGAPAVVPETPPAMIKQKPSLPAPSQPVASRPAPPKPAQAPQAEAEAVQQTPAPASVAETVPAALPQPDQKTTQKVSAAPGAASRMSSVPGTKKEDTFTLRGKVIAATGHLPLPGVSLTLRGSSLGVSSDAEGNFVFPNVRKDDLIETTFVGFLPARISVKDSSVTVELKEDAKTLDEVVVTGVEMNKKNNVKTAVPQIGREAYQTYLETAAGQFSAQHPQAPRGKVVLHFMVNASGELSDFKNRNKAHPVLFEEAVRIITKGSAWLSKRSNGKAQADTVTLTIRFE